MHIIISRPGPPMPMRDLEQISLRLAQENALTPGYIPDGNGVLDLQQMLNLTRNGYSVRLVTDRNLISRMSKIAREGCSLSIKERDRTLRIAIDLMAYSQCLDLIIDPSISFYELAMTEGRDDANTDIAWFRAADRGGRAGDWVDIAQGRRENLVNRNPADVIDYPLDDMVARWSKNYIATLKIASLELQESSPDQKVISFYKWLVEDYLFAGPASIFATMYFPSTGKTKKKLLKELRSHDRELAIRGIKNAAWDITYVSDFVEKVNLSDPYVRYILATGDKKLREMAEVVRVADHVAIGAHSNISGLFGQWWGPILSPSVAAVFIEQRKKIDNRPPPEPNANSKDPIGDMISDGEALVRSWNP